MVQWEKLKTEYISGDSSYRELSEKYGIPYSTLKIHARCDRWVEDRKSYRKERLQKSLNRIVDQQAEDLARVDQAADQLLGKLEQAIRELDLIVIHHKESGSREDGKWEKTYEETTPGGPVDRQGLRLLVACLKELKQVKDIQTELERQEQEARIEKLRREASQEEDGPVTVLLDRDLERFSQ